jgi:hypothetical protein
MISVKFTDGELIQGMGWLDMPKKPIQRLKYQFNGKTIIMEGYESYNHLVERCYMVLGNQVSIRNIFLLGLKGGSVHGVVLNVNTKTITEYDSTFGKEYNNRPSTGWQIGRDDGNPKTQII